MNIEVGDVFLFSSFAGIKTLGIVTKSGEGVSFKFTRIELVSPFIRGDDIFEKTFFKGYFEKSMKTMIPKYLLETPVGLETYELMYKGFKNAYFKLKEVEE